MSWLTYPHQKKSLNPDYIICSHCGKPNSRYNNTCWNCKEEL